MYSAIKQSDAVIIATPWKEFQMMNLDYVKSIVRHPIIIDLHNVMDHKKVKTYGFKYYSIGSYRFL